uniref:Uncharacterized protein n=1 Tax=Megaselia scalaris TaxID=36166 RepID=T1GW35_MEGSC
MFDSVSIGLSENLFIKDDSDLNYNADDGYFENQIISEESRKAQLGALKKRKVRKARNLFLISLLIFGLKWGCREMSSKK